MAIGVVWVFLGLLWAGDVLRSGGSLVFWLAAGAVGVFVAGCVAEVARGRDPWRAARKAVVLVLLVMVPAAFDPKTFDVFNLTKYTVVMVGFLVLAALWAVEWVRRGRAPLWRNGLEWPVIALLAWTAVTTALSTNPRISVLGFYKSYDGLYSTLAFGLIFFAVV